MTKLFNEWEDGPTVRCLLPPGETRKYADWKTIDPYKVIPSDWLQCLNTANKSRPEGQKIRCFVGEGMETKKTISFPLGKKHTKTRSAFWVNYWVALDKGSDHHPTYLPASSCPNVYLRNWGAGSGESYGLLLVLIREQDLPSMYSEEANARALFPNVTLQNLTSLVLANGTESDNIRDMIRVQLKTSNALMAAQLISVDCPSSVQFLLRELNTLEDRDIIPFILRRLEYQCSFKEDLPATRELKESITKSWKAYIDGLTSTDWANKTEIFSFGEDLVRLQLQALQKVPSASLKCIKVIQEVVRAFPDHAEFLGIIYDIIGSIQAERSIPVLVNLISDLERTQPNEPLLLLRCAFLNLLWKKLNIHGDQELIRDHLLGLLLVSNEVEDLALITEVTQRLLMEGSHPSHIACEILTECSISSVKCPFYLEREKEIRESIRVIEEKQLFDGTYLNPKVPLQVEGDDRHRLCQFLEGTQETIQLPVLTHEKGLELSNILTWRHPKWCRFDQPSDHCEENEGFSVHCRIVPLEGGAIAVEVTKTDSHFLHERRYLLDLKEELAWLLLQHNNRKRPLPPSSLSGPDNKISKSTFYEKFPDYGS